MRIIYIEQKFS